MKKLCAGLLSLAFEVAFLSPVFGDTLYVWTNSPADGPGTAWSNAYHDIQTAVDAAAYGYAVSVTDGVYTVGGRVTPGGSLSNRVCITNAVTVQSVNGPGATAAGSTLAMEGEACSETAWSAAMTPRRLRGQATEAASVSPSLTPWRRTARS